jgi:hypothetical protein
MDSQQSRKLATTFVQLADRGADSTHLSEVIVSSWKTIEAALTPIIGRKGVAALYGRSLYLAGAHHPWLQELQVAEGDMDLARLATVLARQGSAAAAAAGGAHLQTLYELLGSLIGPSLTGQLLAPAWDNLFEHAPRRT